MDRSRLRPKRGRKELSDPTINTLDIDTLDDATRAGFESFVVTLADTKRLLGIRYSDWLLGAPSLETGIAASSMCQDEWGHARLLYAMVKDFGKKPIDFEHHREPAQYQSIDALDKTCSDWAGVVAMNLMIDGALSVALEAFSEGSYETARSRVPKMLAEEVFHRDFGVAWFRRLAGANEAAQARLVDATTAVLPRTLAWLAPDDEVHHRLVEAGITIGSKALIARFKGMVGPSLELIGVDIDTVSPNLDGWEPARRRGPGHPDEDAVQRARGDLNRNLFVE